MTPAGRTGSPISYAVCKYFLNGERKVRGPICLEECENAQQDGVRRTGRPCVPGLLVDVSCGKGGEAYRRYDRAAVDRSGTVVRIDQCGIAVECGELNEQEDKQSQEIRYGANYRCQPVGQIVEARIGVHYGVRDKEDEPHREILAKDHRELVQRVGVDNEVCNAEVNIKHKARNIHGNVHNDHDRGRVEHREEELTYAVERAGGKRIRDGDLAVPACHETLDAVAHDHHQNGKQTAIVNVNEYLSHVLTNI